MANPQPTDAHLRIAHSINEQLMVSHFSEQQRRILDFILRLSWGCGDNVAYIPHQRDFEIVGVREGHIKAHLDWLIEAKVIIRQDCYYRFNKDFDQWRVSRAAGYTNRKLTEYVSINLKHDKPKLTENVTENLRNTEDSAYGKRKLPPPKIGTPKEKLNKVLNKDTASKQNLDDYILSLTERFKDIDFDNELEKFWLYWNEGTRKLKNPKLALLNWMMRARKFKENEAGRGAHRRSSRQLISRDSYTKPEDY